MQYTSATNTKHSFLCLSLFLPILLCNSEIFFQTLTSFVKLKKNTHRLLKKGKILPWEFKLFSLNFTIVWNYYLVPVFSKISLVSGILQKVPFYHFHFKRWDFFSKLCKVKMLAFRENKKQIFKHFSFILFKTHFWPTFFI